MVSSHENFADTYCSALASLPLTEIVPVASSADFTGALLVSQGDSPDSISISASHEVLKSAKILTDREKMSQNWSM